MNQDRNGSFLMDILKPHEQNNAEQCCKRVKLSDPHNTCSEKKYLNWVWSVTVIIIAESCENLFSVFLVEVINIKFYKKTSCKSIRHFVQCTFALTFRASLQS